jgi:hypothetical protein
VQLLAVPSALFVLLEKKLTIWFGPMQRSSREKVYSRPRLRCLAIIACLSAAGLCLAWARAHSPINLAVLARDGYGMVPITRPQPNDLVVRGTINGRNATLVLDTGWGADGISLDTGYAMSMKVPTEAVKGYGQSATGALMSVTKGMPGLVGLGNVQIKGVPLFVGTFQVLRNEHVSQSVGANGFVGAGFLHTNSAILDLPNFRLYLRPPGTGRRAVLGPALKAVGLSEVSFSGNGRGQFLVDVEISGATGKMVIDTGAYLSGVDSRFSSQIKAAGYDAGIQMVDAAGVISKTKLAKVGSFKIGGVPVRPPDLTLGTFGFYSASGGKLIGMLGMDVLGQNWGIIDFGNEKLYFSKAK